MVPHVKGRYLSGCDVVLHNCATVNDVKVQVANIHTCLAPEVTLFDANTCEEIKEDLTAPPAQVVIALKDLTYDDGLYSYAIRAHAAALDGAGVQRALNDASRDLPAHIPSPTLCAVAVLKLIWRGMANKQVIDLLLQCGADLRLVHVRDGTTCLHAAAYSTKWAAATIYGVHPVDGRDEGCEVVRALIEGKATVDAIDFGGRTPLFPASSMGHRNICEVLLENGAHVHHESNDGSTALHQAAFQGHLVRAPAEAQGKRRQRRL
eukprot:GEMP01041998.1.p1 GENE.GEMP01041998.1~~GEMP01041998.1.p1  ORF type:complete len:264 (+),score=66.26 GEMP01041998.1:146-937(+)